MLTIYRKRAETLPTSLAASFQTLEKAGSELHVEVVNSVLRDLFRHPPVQKESQKGKTQSPFRPKAQFEYPKLAVSMIFATSVAPKMNADVQVMENTTNT